jgi:hypothetical protein
MNLPLEAAPPLPSPLWGGAGVGVGTVGLSGHGEGSLVDTFAHAARRPRSDFATPTRLGLCPSPPSPQGGGEER